jgi:hypothetical protein
MLPAGDGSCLRKSRDPAGAGLGGWSADCLIFQRFANPITFVDLPALYTHLFKSQAIAGMMQSLRVMPITYNQLDQYPPPTYALGMVQSPYYDSCRQAPFGE